MKPALVAGLCPGAILFLSCCSITAQNAPTAPTNQPAVKDLNTPREFPGISSRGEWEERARQIRQQVLVSCGLWPMPDKTPLNTKIFGKVERDGYSIEKVYFETYPGFYLAGNLYRPLGHGQGPFPAILNPHGHWNNGRMADGKDGSIAARCISFARQGMIAFAYDMVGFNDTHFRDMPTNQPFYEVHRQFATNRADLLWNISLMGLQTWNSIRAVDFLESLPDADRKRLACTGESGGGTQTFMLGAVEDRLAAQAPVVMVSHTMQGGCLCENAPSLRVQFSNMELSAAAAPRPQILVAATGDWTKDTPTVEGPSIAGIYRLLGAPDRFHYVRFDFGHNYNQTSREAVYQWFGRFLLKSPAPAALAELPYQKEPDEALRVFPGTQLPAGALSQQEFINSLKEMHRRQWQALVPQSKSGLKTYQTVMRPAWEHTLQLQVPQSQPRVRSEDLSVAGEFTTAVLRIQPAGMEAEVRARYWAPADLLKKRSRSVVVVCGDQNSPPPSGVNSNPAGLSLELLRRGAAVLAIDQFSSEAPADQFAEFYCTYNRTLLQRRVEDLVAACMAARSADPRQARAFKVILCGKGRAGLWALMAAPAADAVVADADCQNVLDETTLLGPELFCPGLLSLGGFEGAALLAAPHPLFIHNTATNFSADHLASAYKAVGAKRQFRMNNSRAADGDIGAWVSGLN